jgi:hypothetical protein
MDLDHINVNTTSDLLWSTDVTEELLGLVWSLNLAHQNMRGYMLGITSTRVVGAKRSALFHGLEVYLGQGSRATDEDLRRPGKYSTRNWPTKNWKS